MGTPSTAMASGRETSSPPLACDVYRARRGSPAPTIARADLRRRRGAALRDARRAEPLVRRGGHRAAAAAGPLRAAARDPATASPRRRCTTCSRGCGRTSSGPARSGCGRSRRWSAPPTIPVVWALGKAHRRRARGLARGGARRRQPDARVVQPGGSRLRAARAARRAVGAALAARARAAAAGSRGGVGHRRRARARDALLRDLPRRAAGAVADPAGPRARGARARAAALAPVGAASHRSSSPAPRSHRSRSSSAPTTAPPSSPTAR